MDEGATELLELLAGAEEATLLEGVDEVEEAEETGVDEAGEVDWAAEVLGAELAATLEGELLGAELAAALEDDDLAVPTGLAEAGGIASPDEVAGEEAADEAGADEADDTGAVDVAPLATHLYSSRRLPAPQYSVLSPGQRKLQSPWLVARVEPPSSELPQ